MLEFNHLLTWLNGLIPIILSVEFGHFVSLRRKNCLNRFILYDRYNIFFCWLFTNHLIEHLTLSLSTLKIQTKSPEKKTTYKAWLLFSLIFSICFFVSFRFFILKSSVHRFFFWSYKKTHKLLTTNFIWSL